MSEKTLLVELEKEKEKIVEKKLEISRKEAEKRKKQEEKKKENKVFNAFSSKSFKETSLPKLSKEKKTVQPVTELAQEKAQEEQEISKIESKVSAIIEKPNYDYMEGLSNTQREKIFKIERQESDRAKASPSKLKAVVLSIMFALFSVWGIVNIAKLDSVGSQLSEISYQYEMNLPKYLQKLTNLDATSSENMENLLETIPNEDLSPNTILEKSNWCDRFCNFIAGLFGG